MRIRKIRLENVKCFRDELIYLEKKDTGEALSVCAFVGANGSGKSTILKSVVAAFSTFNEEYAGESMEDDAINDGQDFLRVLLELSLNEQEQKWLEYENNSLSIEYRHYAGDEGDSLFVPQEITDDAAMDDYAGALSDLMYADGTGLIMYYDPFRFVSRKNPAGPNILEANSAKRNALASNIGADGENLYRDLELKQWIVNMDYVRLKDPTERNIAIYNHMIKAFELMLHPLKFESIDQSGSLIFIDEKNGQRITMDMLSDGFKSVFFIVLDIIRRLALASDLGEEEFFLKEAVILIDEIDCHIHPKWQRKLMPALRELFPNCQFIITTHSPYILDSLQEYEIKKIGERSVI